MAELRSQSDVMTELGRVSLAKRDAVTAQEFDRAADLRGQELTLQRELHCLGGPRPGCFRIRIDNPDGSYVVHEGPDYAALLDNLGQLDVSYEMNLILDAADILRESLMKGSTRAMRTRSQGVEISVRTLSDLRSPNKGPK